MLKRFLPIILITVFFFIFSAPPSHALWWMIYHKPEFKGKIIDAETKEPIEGAVVVITYSKQAFRFGPHSDSMIIEVKETLTDKEGNFSIPSYTTIIDPLAWESYARFIIFKPGYGNYPNGQISPPTVGVSPEIFFSPEKIGTEGEIYGETRGIIAYEKKVKVTFGIVELPKLKTREERLKAMPSPVEDVEHKTIWYWKKQRQFIRIINEERRNLGLTGEYNIE